MHICAGASRRALARVPSADRGGVGDVNGDGKRDIFFGGSKYEPSQIFVQQDSIFVNQRFDSIQKDSIQENVSAAIADFNGDGKNDLITASGGGDFFGPSDPLLDAYYVQQDTNFTSAELPEYYQNSSVIKPFDFDDDGDLDVFIGGHTITAKFGAPANSYLLENDKGTFKVRNDFERLGKVVNILKSREGFRDTIKGFEKF